MPVLRTVHRMPSHRTSSTGHSATVSNAARVLQRWREEQPDFVPGSTVSTDLVPRLSSPELPLPALPPQGPMEAVIRRLEDEPERKARNAQVAEREAAHKADPTNAGVASEYEQLLAAYEMDYGKYMPDAEVPAFLQGRRRDEWNLSLAREHAALGDAFTNADPLLAYRDDARSYETRYGVPYTPDDGLEEHLVFELKLIQSRADYVERGADLEEELKERVIAFSFTNPYPSHDPRREELDQKFRERVASYKTIDSAALPRTLEQATVSMEARNKYCTEPLSSACARQFFTYQIWREELEALQKQAEEDVRKDPPPPATISWEEFFDLVESLRRDN